MLEVVTNNSVPYSGAGAPVDLGAFGLTARGINAGFSQAVAEQSAILDGYWLPRNADLDRGWILDFQDELAFRNRKGATISISPSPSSGAASNLLQNDASFVAYNAAASPSPVVVEIDCTNSLVLANGNGSFAVGLTFRSSSPSVNPSIIKIEFAGPSLSYVNVFEQTVAQITSAWISPLLPAATPSFSIEKIRITLTVPNPLPAAFRLQRVILYHSTAVFDPWNLPINGGTLLGSVATPLATKTSAYTLTAADHVILADATSAAFSVTLPTAVGITGRPYVVKRLNAASNNVTIATTSSQTIDGSTTHVLSSQYAVARVVSNGANWLLV